MAIISDNVIQLKDEGDLFASEQDLSAPGSTEAVRFQRSEDGVIIAVSGTATSVVFVVERSSRDPGSDPAWSPAQDDAITGNPSTGIAPLQFREPATGFWRVRFTTLSGGTAKISMVGGKS